MYHDVSEFSGLIKVGPREKVPFLIGLMKLFQLECTHYDLESWMKSKFFRYKKSMCLSSFFSRAEIERYPKSKIIVYILDMMCYKMLVIGAPKLVSMR
jgi:uncharacterized membrane protein SirB2